MIPDFRQPLPPSRIVQLTALRAAFPGYTFNVIVTGDKYYSRGFSVRGRAAAQRDALPSGRGYTALHPGRAGGYPVPVTARSRAL
jgi:hypothetical protein